MSDVGLCVGHRVWMPSAADLDELGLTRGWLRMLAYDLDEVDAALDNIPVGVKVCLLLNNETAQVRGDWSGFASACVEVARRFAGRVHVVEAGNELDLWQHLGDDRLTPSFAAYRARQAAAHFGPHGIKTAATSLAGPRWQEYLAEMVDAGLDGVDYCAFHPYGQAVDGFPENWGFGDMETAVRHAAILARRPIAITESGIKIGNAGGEARHAEYVRRWVGLYRSLPESVCAFACFFAPHDILGTRDEQGDQSFGLIRANHTKRPAWDAFAEANRSAQPDAPSGPVAPVPPQPVPIPPPPISPPQEVPTVLPEKVRLAIWTAHVPSAAFNPTFGIEKAWSEDPYGFGPALTAGEITGPDGMNYRPFAYRTIKWDPAKGAVVIGAKAA